METIKSNDIGTEIDYTERILKEIRFMSEKNLFSFLDIHFSNLCTDELEEYLQELKDKQNEIIKEVNLLEKPKIDKFDYEKVYFFTTELDRLIESLKSVDSIIKFITKKINSIESKKLSEEIKSPA